MPRASPTYNLQTEFPIIAGEWHATLNGSLTPSDVAPMSNRKVWWKCAKGPDHEWQTTPANRTGGHGGCPCCAGQKISITNSLATLYPQIAAEWHPTKNHALRPSGVTAGNDRKVWWQCKVDSRHQWAASIYNRTRRGSGCPYCSGRKALPENSFGARYPKLLSEWHPTKNKSIDPFELTPKSGKKVYWRCKYGHVWSAAIYSRASGRGCPKCVNQLVDRTNCLATTHPQLAAQWHEELNAPVSPDEVVSGSGTPRWWICGDGHVWRAAPATRKKGHGCPTCAGQRASPTQNLAIQMPELAKEWHPVKNKGLEPKDLLPGSSKKVWWQCEFGHEWKAIVASRSRGTGCPKCSRQTSELEISLYCELKTIFPNVRWQEKVEGAECDILLADENIAIEIDGYYWHKDKTAKDLAKNSKLAANGIEVIRIRDKKLGKLRPRDLLFTKYDDCFEITKAILEKFRKGVDANSARKIESYVKAGARQNQREANRLISYLPAPPPEQSFAEAYPAFAAEWNCGRNHPITPEMLRPKSNKNVWWQCAAGHEWEMRVSDRARGHGCPYCSGHRVSADYNFAAKHPKLARQWHPTKNLGLKPEQLTPGSGETVWWLCPEDHEFEMAVYRRASGTGCPICSGRYPTPENNLAARFPEIAALWHPTRNGRLRPSEITPHSNKRIWFLCPVGHEWDATAHNAVISKGCPYCLGRRVCFENSLAGEKPKLAAEWHPSKNSIESSEVRPNSNKKVWWVCKKGHEWEATVAHRTSGRGCPKCRNESRTEIVKKAWATRRSRKLRA